MELRKYYFTYGSEGQPFRGGWTEIWAKDVGEACDIFRENHPDRDEGWLNCSSVYSEAQFKATRMYTNGNLGKRCHEVLGEVGA